MEKPKTLIKKRANLESKLKIFDEQLAVLEARETVSAIKVGELQLRLEKFGELYNNFDDIQSKLELICEDSKLDEQYMARTQFEDLYFSILNRAQNLCSSYTNVENQTLNNTSAQSIAGSAKIESNIKLPPLQLSSFDGTIGNWIEFRDMFISIVHNNDSIAPVQKFQYLKSCLSATALESIKSFEMSANNYVLAWEKLCRRYNNERNLIRTHIKGILDLPAILRESATVFRTFTDALSNHVLSLKSLKQPVQNWHTIFLAIVEEKLDKGTIREWENAVLTNFNVETGNMPTLDALLDLLNRKAVLLEQLDGRRHVDIKIHNPRPHNRQSFHVSHNQSAYKSHELSKPVQYSCYFCKGAHSVYSCQEFLALSPEIRLEKVRSKGLCINCLRSSHRVKTCPNGKCKHCFRKHNSLLHIEAASHDSAVRHERATDINVGAGTSHACITHNQILLSTAIAKIRGSDNVWHDCRILLDSGSQSSFISKACSARLGLKLENVNSLLTGIGARTNMVQHMCHIAIKSDYSKFASEFKCFVLDKISDKIPTVGFNYASLNIPEYIKLADIQFNVPSDIDILIGAEMFWDICLNEYVKLGQNKPVLRETVFGWIVTGSVPTTSTKAICHLAQLDFDIRKFWELEDCPHFPTDDSVKYDIEEHFATTHTRLPNGRFVVRLPFNDKLKDLGDSYSIARSRLTSMENKFKKDKEYHRLYKKFMTELIELGHMRKLTEFDKQAKYFLPHHGVLKSDSLTTKLRVVFDGSADTTTGISLNDTLLVGPTIQSDLVSKLLRFRKWRWVLLGDIEKMYRQINVHPDDCCYTCILYRENENDPVEIFILLTLPYGLSCASFLAINSLNEVGKIHRKSHPLASLVILRDFYVDDLMTGHDDPDMLSSIGRDVINVLKSGCFELRKLMSNDPAIAESLVDGASDETSYLLCSDEKTKALGILWLIKEDCISYKITICNDNLPITKRAILSTISRLFDPLGLLSPFLVLVKILLQRLWVLGLEWDEKVPLDIEAQWRKIVEELPQLSNLKIPRWIFTENYDVVQLHGFCDASKLAYGGAVYVRCISSNNVVTRLVCAKSRVAPIKTVSIPRLELCGALLIAQLICKVREALELDIPTFYWCDSQVAICWIKSQPQLLNNFVRNRVEKIQEMSKTSQWYYINTKENVADFLSRGATPAQLLRSSFWLGGPAFLSKSDITEYTKNKGISSANIPDECQTNVVSCTAIQAPINEPMFLFERFSDFNKLVKVTAYILRFFNVRKAVTANKSRLITRLEFDVALEKLIKIVQAQAFAAEIADLNTNKYLTRGSLLGLSPFVDQNGVLRVGGRLKHSCYPQDKKHPIVLPKGHIISKLIMKNEHIRSLHGGPQQILSLSREKYWIVSGKTLAKQVVRSCVTCFRFKAATASAIMGQLPKYRINQSYPFSNTGIDYCGPFLINDRRGRGARKVKVWVCLFVCLATKAIHLEAVSELSSDAFLAVLRRFVSRRGLPSSLHSDNGRNFVGADRELREVSDFLTKNSAKIHDSCTNLGIEWKFLPPYSPHMGGIWESNIKCMKSHLYKTLKQTSLVFEEFETVLIQIEAILNSRPLYPLSTDPNDLQTLTPGHFLIGRPLLSVPERQLDEVPIHRLNRFQYLQQLQQHYWNRWRLDYLNHLQTKSKWKRPQPPLRVNSMVLLKDTSLPCLRWRPGRVVAVHPGADGVVRVATVRTSTGETKRAITQLCPFPEDNATD